MFKISAFSSVIRYQKCYQRIATFDTRIFQCGTEGRAGMEIDLTLP